MAIRAPDGANNVIILKFKNWKWTCVSNGFASERAPSALD